MLGSSVAGDGGRYTAALNEPLAAKQRIFPASSGVEGSIVTAGSYDVFLPMSIR